LAYCRHSLLTSSTSSEDTAALPLDDTSVLSVTFPAGDRSTPRGDHPSIVVVVPLLAERGLATAVLLQALEVENATVTVVIVVVITTTTSAAAKSDEVGFIVRQERTIVTQALLYLFAFRK